MNSFELESVDADGTLFTAKYRTPFAKSRSVLVKLGDKRFLVYSPGEDLVAQARTLIPEDAEVVLLVPNKAHTSGIHAWLEAFPLARLVASESVASVLVEKKHTPEVLPVTTWARDLPKHVTLRELPGCSLGEVWMIVELGEVSYWVVCDGIMNLNSYSSRWLKRTLQKLYGLKLGLWMTQVFCRSLADKSEFKRWALALLAKTERPVLIPCHGEIYDKADLPENLNQLIEARL